MTSGGHDDGGGRPSELSETLDLLKRYLLQETLEPLKSLGRVLLFGCTGALLLGTGFVVLDLAALRAFQEETGSAFAGHWTFVPYLLAIVVALLLAGAAWYAVSSGPGGRAGKRAGGPEEAATS